MLECAAGEVEEKCLKRDARRNPVTIDVAEEDVEARTPLLRVLVTALRVAVVAMP